ncbi:hypothetical protein TpMuguga_04g00432 [Theileria parva strain Muguga]|uniref:Uncharacterized protein n=1 Tax=Theileria parva TaxID=5875 RepID=Q4N2B9_THEPA|nr:uncharacterized protein TpMuguga_04g00432 [Theileria parva strain Muguga]EAN31784.1 hypothetical protein TpMuguga_04g00432 [Theileria parva strain Muguga]|eukprot:XP_764067.1 hypothetical protein [Theileria parva strain Muguga]
MNFIKGIVDGILATDIDSSTGKSKYSYDPDVAHDDSDPHSLGDIFQNRIISNDNVFLNTSISNLSELYKIERENCIKGLVLRYGEGCVQHLSQLLKSNHETILTLSNQIQGYLSALNDVNSRMESAAVEHLRLKNENINLVQGLQLLESENSILKSQLEQANINIKSSENQISMLNELLRENRNTFDNMKDRCEEFYTLKSQIESLNKKLALSENHIAMLNKERDEFWSNPNHKLTDNDYKNRILEALQRQDRALSVAKLMASQNSQSGPKSTGINQETHQEPAREVDLKELSDLRLRVDQLEDENSHLKEINDSLHTMCADISKNLKEVKATYLKESVDNIKMFMPTKTNPIQLVFVQPTGVLDLSLDQEYLSKLSQSKDSDYSKQQYQHLDASHTPQSTQHSTSKDSLGLNPSQLQSNKPKPQRRPKKTKMNLRSKVINYVTNLDASSSSESDETHPPQTIPQDTENKHGNQPESSRRAVRSQFEPKVHQVESHSEPNVDPHEPQVVRGLDKGQRLSSWNSDWDFLEEDQSASNKETSVQPSTEEPKVDTLNFNNSGSDENKLSHPTFSEDGIFDSIINEQENENSDQKVEPGKSKAWDDLDFDTSNS